MNNRAQEIQKVAYAMVAFVFVFGGLGFGWYIWKETPDVDPNRPRSDYVDSQPDAPQEPKLTPGMAVSVEERAQGVVAVVTVTNNTAQKMILPETRKLDALYKVTLRYAPNATAPMTEVKTTPAPALGEIVIIDGSNTVEFDPDHDAAQEVMSMQSHTVTIPLTPPYKIIPGRYELDVALRPLNLVSTSHTPLPRFNVSAAIARTRFEYPFANKAK